MSNDIIIKSKKKDLGGFSVTRCLPTVQKRQVGPFVFLDHMGPMSVDANRQLNVRPHPHIGLATVTYLFEGRGLHRDSLGSNQVISPGDINWMTAGRGIVHSERTPQEELVGGKHIHGIQIWVALPTDNEEDEPHFYHWDKQQLPEWEIAPGVHSKLLLGQQEDYKSPVKIFSPTLFMDLKITKGADSSFQVSEKEAALLLIEGDLQVNGNALEPDDLICVDSKTVQLQSLQGARAILIGGEPFAEPRYMWWNFVSSRKERIRQAAADWKAQTMGQVPGETEYIPLPEDPLPK